MVQTCMQLSNGIAIFTRIPALQFFCVLCEILQETTRFFTFSKNCFCVAIQKKRLFCVLRFDRYTCKTVCGRLPFALRFVCVPYILQVATRFFTFSKNCFRVAIQNNVCFVFCGLSGKCAQQFAVGYLLRCVLRKILQSEKYLFVIFCGQKCVEKSVGFRYFFAVFA